MNELIRVNIKYDKSVERKINKKAKNLEKTYHKKRNINEKRLLKKQSRTKKVMSIVFDIICALSVVVCGLFCFSAINSRFQGTATSFAGYSSLKVSSGSMVASGFNVGDNIIVRSVDTKTLNVGDKIAFYVYSGSYKNFSINSCIKITETYETKYSLTFKKFFGLQSSEILDAASAGSMLVFHEIIAIYEDTETGVRWFQTKGSSNESADSWRIEESMVLGIYDDSATAVFLSKIFTVLSSSGGIMTSILIPVVLMAIVLVLEFSRDVAVAKLELDVVEEKRKITDEICVKNNIGFNMDTKTKYKVLAQAPDDKKTEYLALLWKDGSAPDSIKKYCHRKQIVLEPMQKMLEIHRTCDEMFKNGESSRRVAKYYYSEKAKIEEDHRSKQRQIKEIRKQYNSI